MTLVICEKQNDGSYAPISNLVKKYDDLVQINIRERMKSYELGESVKNLEEQLEASEDAAETSKKHYAELRERFQESERECQAVRDHNLNLTRKHEELRREAEDLRNGVIPTASMCVLLDAGVGGEGRYVDEPDETLEYIRDLLVKVLHYDETNVGEEYFVEGKDNRSRVWRANVSAKRLTIDSDTVELAYRRRIATLEMDNSHIQAQEGAYQNKIRSLEAELAAQKEIGENRERRMRQVKDMRVTDTERLQRIVDDLRNQLASQCKQKEK